MNDILASLSTKQELQHFLTSLGEVEQGLYTLMSDTKKVLAMHFPPEQLDQITSYFIKNKLDVRNKEQFSQFVTGITSAASSLPLLSLTLSFAPTSHQVSQIARWLAQNSTTHYLLDITIVPEIIGGTRIGINGTYKDYSVKKTVTEYFAKTQNIQYEIPK
ncbi:hypothetical protein BH11PAT1_BH11PAT1_7440 [soil metagenome]